MAADILTFLLRSFAALLVLYSLYIIGSNAFIQLVSPLPDPNLRQMLNASLPQFYLEKIIRLVGGCVIWFLSRPLAVFIAECSFTKDDRA